MKTNNKKQYRKFAILPNHADYSTNNIIIIDNTILNRKPIHYYANAIENNGLYSMLSIFENIQRAYSYFNIENEVVKNVDLVIGYPPDDWTDFDYVLYMKYKDNWYMCDPDLLGFILFRIPKKDHKNLRYFVNIYKGVHTLVVVYNSRIIAVIAGLYTEQRDIPRYLKNGV